MSAGQQGRRDHYQILGVTPRASAAEIKRAYRALVFRYHPDLNPDDPRAEERMKEINAAVDALLRNACRPGHSSARGPAAPQAPYTPPRPASDGPSRSSHRATPSWAEDQEPWGAPAWPPTRPSPGAASMRSGIVLLYLLLLVVPAIIGAVAGSSDGSAYPEPWRSPPPPVWTPPTLPSVDPAPTAEPLSSWPEIDHAESRRLAHKHDNVHWTWRSTRLAAPREDSEMSHSHHWYIDPFYPTGLEFPLDDLYRDGGRVFSATGSLFAPLEHLPDNSTCSDIARPHRRPGSRDSRTRFWVEP